MLREITLGQYYPTDSVIHKMDPRTKLFATVIYIISIFCFRGPIGFVAITAGLIAVIYLSKVPFSFMVRGLKAIVFILVFAGILNLFMTPGRELISIWKFTVTYEGAKNASLMLFRMIYLIIGTSVMTLTTTPNQLTDGLETALKPFAKIKVPVHEISMMMSIALRFIPILVEETDKIMKAQMARGADFESGGIIKKVKSMVPLLVPLFVSAFRRANDLALAMEARCYHGGEGRTKMIPLHYEHRDKVAYAIVIVYIVLIFILRKFA